MGESSFIDVSSSFSWGDPYGMIATSTSLIANTEAYLSALQSQSGQLAAPVINPSFPTVTSAPVPSLIAMPSLSLPPDWTLPDQPEAALNTFNWPGEIAYTSDLLVAAQGNLTDALNGVFTSLNAQAQQAIWDAAREREYRQQADALAGLDQMESLGYAFPPGVYLDARIKIQTETNNTLAGLSRDIMVKQAELQLENVVKAREAVIELEGKLIGYASEVANRSFGAAKYEVEASIQIYQAKIAGFDAVIRGLVGEAQASASYNTAIASVYSAEASALSAYNEAIIKAWEAVINEQEKITEIAVAAAKANGDLYIAARGLSLDASKVGAQVNAQLGAAALGAISWHSSISQGNSFSSSDSTSKSTNYNNNNSTSASNEFRVEQITTHSS